MHTLSLAELAAGLQSKRFSSVELTRHFLQRIERHNSALNAFITVTAEAALADAAQADRTLAAGKGTALTGLPLAHKDIFCTDGVLTTCASRMLSNFVCAGKPLLQTFLLGQPEFRRILQSASMEQLRQRVIATCHLGPMDRAETEAYIVHRLRTAGWRDDPSFSSDAFAAIYQHTGGIPRKINVLCDRLLLMGRLDEKHAFTGKEVAEVINDLRQEFAPANMQVNQKGEG